VAIIVLVQDEKGNVKRVEKREPGATWIPFPEARKAYGAIQQIKMLNPIVLFGRPTVEALGIDAINASPLLTPEQKAEYVEIYRTSSLGDDFDVEFEQTVTYSALPPELRPGDGPPPPALGVLGPPADTANGKGNRPTFKIFAYFIDP
jgi:hypothetical protein